MYCPRWRRPTTSFLWNDQYTLSFLKLFVDRRVVFAVEIRDEIELITKLMRCFQEMDAIRLSADPCRSQSILNKGV
jgi:hypothetical protein